MNASASGYFTLALVEDGRYVFQFKGADHVVLLRSRPYLTHADARMGIDAMRECVAMDPCFDLLRTPEGEPYFILRTPQGRLIGVSASYLTQEALNKAIAQMRAQCPGLDAPSAPAARCLPVSDLADLAA